MMGGKNTKLLSLGKLKKLEMSKIRFISSSNSNLCVYNYNNKIKPCIYISYILERNKYRI